MTSTKAKFALLRRNPFSCFAVRIYQYIQCKRDFQAAFPCVHKRKKKPHHRNEHNQHMRSWMMFMHHTGISDTISCCAVEEEIHLLLLNRICVNSCFQEETAKQMYPSALLIFSHLLRTDAIHSRCPHQSRLSPVNPFRM